MEALGFSYVPFPYFNTDDLYALSNPLNEDVARRFGYQEPLLPEAADPNLDTSDRFLQALNEPQGCGRSAFLYVYDGPKGAAFSTAFDSLVPKIEQAVVGRFAATDEARILESQWATCMDELGYRYSSPSDAASAFSATAEPTTEEIEVRLSDLRCDREVGLTQSRSSHEAAAVATQVDINALAVAEQDDLLLDAFDEVIDRSEQLSSQGARVLPQPPANTGPITASTPPTSSP